MKNSGRSSSGRAFTWLELLVVIAIIGILAGMAMSALSGAKAQAKTTFCKNNLSEIGKALAMSTSDFGKYPGTRSVP
jgi:prepilin-type N-terminal cleavage/methylation domain-containing protein